jgi:hypothetical protein
MEVHEAFSAARSIVMRPKIPTGFGKSGDSWAYFNQDSIDKFAGLKRKSESIGGRTRLEHNSNLNLSRDVLEPLMKYTCRKEKRLRHNKQYILSKARHNHN